MFFFFFMFSTFLSGAEDVFFIPKQYENFFSVLELISDPKTTISDVSLIMKENEAYFQEVKKDDFFSKKIFEMKGDIEKEATEMKEKEKKDKGSGSVFNYDEYELKNPYEVFSNILLELEMIQSQKKEVLWFPVVYQISNVFSEVKEPKTYKDIMDLYTKKGSQILFMVYVSVFFDTFDKISKHEPFYSEDLESDLFEELLRKKTQLTCGSLVFEHINRVKQDIVFLD